MLALTPLEDMLEASPYLSYTYSYPHKTAYRPLQPVQALSEVWEPERREALFLYIHLPFCEMRCGFCNLFTTLHPGQDFISAYLATLRRQARQVRQALGEASFARFALGCGTPTYLSAAELAAVFDLAEELYGLDLSRLPVSVETSPGTSQEEKLILLRERGVDRISIGIQSFVEEEVRAAGRAQKNREVEAALSRIKDLDFPVLNLDLIYGLPGQTVASWLASLETALKYRPQELYLYPLYTRPLTGLGRTGKSWDDQRLECYRAGRSYLLNMGYEQVSMRMFRASSTPMEAGPVYCCQEDGMVGLGCGARSYTRALHYSSEYAVSARGVRAILSDYLTRSDESFSQAVYGFRLDQAEQRRRYVIQSLLQKEGLDEAAYRECFGSAALVDLPGLRQLVELGLAEHSHEKLVLTEMGLERSDTIGPWLYSEQVQTLMEEYELR
ncbi:MAG TPA: STM4012 family radical SAM protein [Chloroflexia bacterium]|nr:STM4012 family radical SAM protein [Chloroflexia bacterium]